MSRTGDIHRSAVIDGRAENRHTAGNRNRAFEVERLRRDVSLIVVEREDAVEFADEREMEDGIRSDGACDGITLFLERFDRRRYIRHFFGSEQSVFARMRIQSRDGHRAFGHAEFFERVETALYVIDDALFFYHLARFDERYVPRQKENAQAAHFEHRKRIARVRQRSEDFRVADKGYASRFERFFVDRSRSDGRDFMFHRERNAFFDIIVCGFSAHAVDFTDFKPCHVDIVEVDEVEYVFAVVAVFGIFDAAYRKRHFGNPYRAFHDFFVADHDAFCRGTRVFVRDGFRNDFRPDTCGVSDRNRNKRSCHSIFPLKIVFKLIISLRLHNAASFRRCARSCPMRSGGTI